MNEPQTVSPFRIAFRVEGLMIHAYFAPPETMAGAVLLGSVLKSICDEDRAVWEAFKALMRQSMTTVMRAAIGVEAAEFIEEPAPEHEKAGSA